MPLRARIGARGGGHVTIVWFIVWFVANLIGDSEPLIFDPVNGWAGTLLAAIALDLGRQHAPELGKSGR
jgi:hypothetical protein